MTAPLKATARKVLLTIVGGKKSKTSWQQIGDGDALQNKYKEGFACNC